MTATAEPVGADSLHFRRLLVFCRARVIRCRRLGKMRSSTRSKVRRARVVVLVAAVALPGAAAPAAQAAQISIEAPESCLDPAALTDEVSNLVGKPLGSVADVDFRVAIAQLPHRGWRLRLETIDSRPAAGGAATVLGSREIDAASCAELAEAASVAIAVAVRSIDRAARSPPAASTTTSPAPAAPAPPPRRRCPSAHPCRGPSWQPALALAFATDSGALPTPASASISRDICSVARLAWSRSRPGSVPRRSGRRRTGAAGSSCCSAASSRAGIHAGAAWTPLACGGFELGRLSGTGLGVARPETGDAFWRALRGDLGFSLAMGRTAAILLRAGLVRPLVRPEFVLDQSQPVHRPDALTVRLTAGLQLGF